MNRHFRRLLPLAAALALTVAPLDGQELEMSFKDGRVTLVAKDVALGAIMAEWARAGQTAITGGNKLTGPAVTLELVDEAEALQLLLRSASGYVAAPRRAAIPGASDFDGIVILATSRVPESAPVCTNGPRSWRVCWG